MKKTLSLLIATTALTAAIGIPAWAMLGTGSGSEPAVLQSAGGAAPLVLVDDDEDDDDEHKRESRRAGHDDDEDDDDCEDGACGGANNPAPAGSVTPPGNGLFGTGAPPKVQVN